MTDTNDADMQRTQIRSLCKLLAAHVVQIDTTLQDAGAATQQELSDAMAAFRQLSDKVGDDSGDGAEGAEASLADLEACLLATGKILQMHDILRQYHELVRDGVKAMADLDVAACVGNGADHGAQPNAGMDPAEIEELLWQLCHSAVQRDIHRQHFPDREAEPERPAIQLF